MGEVFAGRYELADPIGHGGVGAVWRAWDHRRKRYVAAKVLQQSDAHALLRFVREQALRIDHPHVLAPASWAADDDKVLFTMDLVAGGSLVHLVGDYGPLPPAFVCTLLDQLLSGLASVHAEGVVHRDIKPANILLEASGTARPRLRLSDFGIAMRFGEARLTETNLVVGTPGYIAPEQLLGAEPDFTADLFAVGLVALFLLEGAKPDAKALVQLFAEHGTPGAPKGIPDPLWQVVATLLQPNPEFRFRTATGARKALAQARELLPEPGPDDELIEIFDQLGPLPAGFAPEGPSRATSGGDSRGATGTAGQTGTTGRVVPTGATGTTDALGPAVTAQHRQHDPGDLSRGQGPPPRAGLLHVAAYQGGEVVQGGARQRQAGGVDKAVRALDGAGAVLHKARQLPSGARRLRPRRPVPAWLAACGEPSVGPFVQPAAIGEPGHLRPQRFQLPAHRHLKPQLLAHRPDLHRAVGLPHDRQDPAVVARQGDLVSRVTAVRNEQDRPPGHLRLCRNDSLGIGLDLLGQAVQHPLRDRQFVPLGLDFLKLLGQLLGESVQFAPASGDPLPLLHSAAPAIP
ncbi:serine/threonine-protein kinase [Streptomyces sp. NPDC048279]|uniref:serine/threonine-protein kinase n=1 Tax=Streptomyces sp. NPDC048279 TaxID=3154714 RepID=UPI003444A3E7